MAKTKTKKTTTKKTKRDTRSAAQRTAASRRSSLAATASKAAKRKPSGTPVRKHSEFPNGPEFDQILQEAEQIERARYHQEVRSTAAVIVGEEGDNDERIDERIREAADSAVTYTRDAWRIAWLSDRSDAIEDELGDTPSDWGATGVTDVITKIAYFAYEQDLREYVDAFRKNVDA